MIDNYVEAATRQFTDRQKPRALFEENVKQIEKTKVISYYGIGGIGKTRLLSFLKQETPNIDPNIISIHIDFKESFFRNIGELLNAMKFQISKNEKIDFYGFDLAYAIYWVKTQPGELPMERKQMLVQEDHLFFDILVSLEGIPYASLIPKAINLMGTITHKTKSSKWWREKGHVLATQINILQDIQSLRNVLLDLWVQDVKTYLKKNNKKIVFFFDSFEYLDLNWLPRVKTLTTLFSDYPVLFIIGSRNKLNWVSTEEVIVDEHLVGELSENDIRSFLHACGVACQGSQCQCQQWLNGTSDEKQALCKKNHEQIINRIIHVTNGVPAYLDLMVDTYIQVKKTTMPKPEHFTERKDEIVELLLQHFKELDIAVLELLSFPKYWNFQIVKQLFNEFNPGLSISQLHRYYEYSFIQRENKEHITMQSFMRNWLQDNVKLSSIEFYEAVHLNLFNYFNETSLHKHFTEAAYHAERGLSRLEYESWLFNAISHLQNTGYSDTIIYYLEPLLEKDFFTAPTKTKLYTYLFTCYYQLGNYSELIAKAALAIDLANETSDFTSKTRIHYLLGCAYHAISEYELSMKHLKLSITNDATDFQTIETHMHIGKVALTISDFKTAQLNYLHASKLVNTMLQQHSNNTELNSLAGQCYEKLGELMGYYKKQQEQLRLYKQSIHYFKIALTDEQHPQYLEHLMLLGFSTKRLAEAFEIIEQAGDPIATFKEATKIYEKVLETTPYYIDCLEKMGHACADWMRVAHTKKQYDSMKEAYKKADKAFQTIISIVDNQGSSLNRLSSIRLEMAKLALEQFELDNAKMYLDEAIYYCELTEQQAPKYAYLATKKQKIEEVTARYKQVLAQDL